MNNIDAIVSLNGLDAILIGPYDLSANPSVTGEINHPHVQDAISTTIATCNKHNIQLGYFGMTAEAARPCKGKKPLAY